MSWNRSRFSQWEVEGEVRQRVGKALARSRAGQDGQPMPGRKRRGQRLRRTMGRLEAGLGLLEARAGARVRALQVLEKGAGEAKGTG